MFAKPASRRLGELQEADEESKWSWMLMNDFSEMEQVNGK